MLARVRVLCGGCLGASVAKNYASSMAAAPLSADDFKIAPYSVLGTRLSSDGVMRDAAPPPSTGECAFVDPAGLPYIQRFGPSGAGGAAGAIYKFLNINFDDEFPPEVVAAVTRTGHAKAHQYSSATCIHVVGPDFNQGRSETYEEATEALAEAYTNVLIEFDKCEEPELRLLPISGGIFAGPFRDKMPALTRDAIAMACDKLDGEVAQRLASDKRITMCIFAEAEWAEFGEHFQVDTRITPVVAPTEIKIAESLPPVGAPPSRL